MHLALQWHGDMKFANAAGSPAIELQSSAAGVTSPPEALAYAVMGCMAMDVLHVIRKGRHELEAMTVRFTGERAAEHPRRFVSMVMHFELAGNVTSAVVERAIELSRTKYCSVWNTIRPDVSLQTSFAIHPRHVAP
ncbi:MAG: OsmC family protein [Acidobacteriota bacterium]